MSVCAVIVTYNAGRDLLKCFDSIRGQVDKVVIVDNGSDQETIKALNGLENEDNVIILYNNDNLGIAAALNTGARYALDKQYDWIIFLDQDSRATAGMVRSMLDEYNKLIKLHQSIRVGVLAPEPCDINLKATRGDKSSIEARMAITSGSMIRSGVFESAGFFTEELFMYYVDDDFCIRARKAGYGIFIVNRARLLHSEGKKEARKIFWKTLYHRNYSPVANYYIFRNGMYILKKYGVSEARYIKVVINRMFADIIKIIFFSRNRAADIRFSVKGLNHGIMGRYGKLQSKEA